MSIDNVLASVAVKDLEAASAWYAKLFGHPATTPMAEVAEWRFPRGGCLQVYQLPERAGRGSFTVAVSDIEAETRKLVAMGLDTSQPGEDGDGERSGRQPRCLRGSDRSDAGALTWSIFNFGREHCLPLRAKQAARRRNRHHPRGAW